MPRITRNSNKPLLQPPNNIPLGSSPNSIPETPVSKPLSIEPNLSVAASHLNMGSKNLNLEQELKIDVSTLSEENRKLVRVILSGMDSLVQRELKKIQVDHERELGSLEKHIVTLEDRIDDLENYGRRNTLIISGKNVPRTATDENSIDVAVDCIQRNLGVDISRNDIDIAHRLGKPQAASEDRRSIIVKLVRRENKHKIYAACRIKKPENIYFSDSVSKTRSTIMFVLRKACKDFPLVFGRYRTEDGNVRVFMPKPGENDGFEKITINTRSKLEDLLRTKANVDSSRWQVAWK